MERTKGIISGPLANIFGFGKNASTSPVVPGMAAGNMSGLQPTQADMSWYNKTMRDQAVDKIRQTLPPEDQGRFDTVIAQNPDNPLEAAKQFQPGTTNYVPPALKVETPDASDLTDLEREIAAYGGLIDQREKAADARLQTILDYQTDAAKRAQQFGKEAAAEAFKYEMMGRIPDTIMAGLAGSGQLMREGAKDISNTVMRGVEALPKPNISARTYQNPTFRYFQ